MLAVRSVKSVFYAALLFGMSTAALAQVPSPTPQPAPPPAMIMPGSEANTAPVTDPAGPAASAIRMGGVAVPVPHSDVAQPVVEGAPAAQPAADAAKSAEVAPKVDDVTLDDVRDKLVVTPDAYWTFTDRMRLYALLKEYNDRQQASR